MVKAVVSRARFRPYSEYYYLDGIYRVLVLIEGKLWCDSEISSTIGVIGFIAGLENVWFGQVELEWN